VQRRPAHGETGGQDLQGMVTMASGYDRRFSSA